MGSKSFLCRGRGWKRSAGGSYLNCYLVVHFSDFVQYQKETRVEGRGRKKQFDVRKLFLQYHLQYHLCLWVKKKEGIYIYTHTHKCVTCSWCMTFYTRVYMFTYIYTYVHLYVCVYISSFKYNPYSWCIMTVYIYIYTCKMSLYTSYKLCTSSFAAICHLPHNAVILGILSCLILHVTQLLSWKTKIQMYVSVIPQIKSLDVALLTFLFVRNSFLCSLLLSMRINFSESFLLFSHFE